ncbi:MAG TPA: polysaccharide deacetylase family protein [Anaerolineales bacterium]|nr:polysaccharide deacetylase family protein [Anaerolineales bacterium]HMS00371.1 polysaccharide deacetylase family protein [Anaerolineales bacterium]HNQ94481.1 polysaccharide deacetylase family protein [Anaerolineales bacterium]HNS61869.1 polysaccharide deacetylase family protein [Anaerolineales bacterium]
MTGIFLLGCGGFGLIAPPTPTLTLEPTRTLSPSLTPFQPVANTPTFLPTDTFTPSPTFTPTSTLTPTITPTPQFIFQGPGNVTVPILLYHHIGYSFTDSEYYVSPEAFENQMNYLFMHGYRTISVEQLTQAIYFGAQLPSRPILLTFDDGSETVYINALPVMQTYGFTGTAYIVDNYIGANRYMDKAQIRALYEAGWEIGSHSLSHRDLTTHPAAQEEEIVNSRKKLESYLDVPVRSFAYPFGAYDSNSLKLIKFAGYVAAMGLGDKSIQGKGNIYYLYRHSITAETTLESFIQILPWNP